MDTNPIAQAIDDRLPFAETMFHDLEAQTSDDQGVTRPAWSPQDQYAADLVADTARSLALEVSYDPAGNVYATLPGIDRSAPGLLSPVLISILCPKAAITMERQVWWRV